VGLRNVYTMTNATSTFGSSQVLPGNATRLALPIGLIIAVQKASENEKKREFKQDTTTYLP
jgi:hypothetical protein